MDESGALNGTAGLPVRTEEFVVRARGADSQELGVFPVQVIVLPTFGVPRFHWRGTVVAGEPATADASATLGPHLTPIDGITRYDWCFATAPGNDFLDCTEGVPGHVIHSRGPEETTITHTFPVPGFYRVRMYVRQEYRHPLHGYMVSQSTNLGGGVSVHEPGGPAPSFTVSPSSPEPGQTVTFDASASFHQNPARSIVRYAWDFNSDGVLDEIHGPGQATAQHAFSAGLHEVILHVTDDDPLPLTRTAVRQVRVHAFRGPTASFTISPSPSVVGQAVTFDASASSDPNPSGGILGYEWDLDGDGLFEIRGGTSNSVVQNTYTAQGSYLVRLRVLNADRPPRTDEAVRPLGIDGIPLIVTKTGAGSGVVTSEIVTPDGSEPHPGIMCGMDCGEGYDLGTAVKLIATPDPGSRFVSYGQPDAATPGCADTNGLGRECFLFMTGPRHVSVEFAR
jgi:PKD repeat protein